MMSRLLVIISILLFAILFYPKTESFLDLNELEKPLHIENECDWKETENCEGDIPLITVGCNNIPNFPKGLEPKVNKINNVKYPKVAFNRLAPKNGRFTFIIPELKYDGIYSRKLDRNNRCCWSTKPNNPETYGSDNLFHVPKESLYGRTVFEPPECTGFSTGYSPEYYL